jgi:hypothetical protein
MRVVEAVRARHDGERRNPWNEPECGHHYARAMASWAVLLALSGFQYSAVSGRLELAPRWKPETFRGLWSVPSGWGTVAQDIAEGRQVVRWEVLWGELCVHELRCLLPEGALLTGASLLGDGGARPVSAEQDGRAAVVTLSDALAIRSGSPLVLEMGLWA